MSTMFADYNFHLMINGDIILDAELKPEQINVKNGDLFEIVLVDGAIVLKKIQAGS